MKLIEVASHNLYREAAQQTEREARKAREKERKESRRAKYFDGAEFSTFQYDKSLRGVRA